MSDGKVFLFAERTLGRGWVGVHVPGLELAKGVAQVCFMRWGHKFPFLGMQGWQVAETWCEVQALGGEMGMGAGVLLGPAITGLLEQGSNYKLSIRTDGVTRFDRPVRWGGIAANSPRKSGPDLASAEIDRRDDIAEKAWQRARDDKDEQALIQFIKEHPTSQHIPATKVLLQEIADRKLSESKHEADAAAWLAAQADDVKNAYEAYCRQFPEATFASQARDALAHFLPDQILIRTSFTNVSSLNQAFDLDTCVYLLSDQRKVRVDRDFVCWFATEEGTGASLATSTCGSVSNRGKSKAVQPGLTSETIAVDLSRIPGDISSIALTLSLDPLAPAERGLETIDYAVVEVLDPTTSESLLSIDFKKGQLGVKGNFIAEIARRGPDWKIASRELAFEGGIDALCAYFGVAVQ